MRMMTVMMPGISFLYKYMYMFVNLIIALIEVRFLSAPMLF